MTTRKRAAGVLDVGDDVEDGNRGGLKETRNGSIDGPGIRDFGIGNYREQVCLCQPDPKIPRPRNGMYHSQLMLEGLHLSRSPLAYCVWAD